MDEASSPNETSAEAVTRACEEKATPAETAGKVSAREPATFIVDEGTSDPGRKVEIRINLGFDDQSLQTLFSSLKSAHPSQPQTAEYIRLTAPFRDEAFTSTRKQADDRSVRVSPIALLLMFAIGFGLKLRAGLANSDSSLSGFSA